MDVCSAYCKSDSRSVSDFCESSKQTLDCASGNQVSLCVNDLGNHFTEFLNIEDSEDSIDISNTQREDVSEDTYANDSDITHSEKCLIKCATFPCSDTSTSPAEFVHKQEQQEADVTAEVLAHNTDAKSTDLSYSRSISLPTPLKLESAIKGSREKQGKLPRKLSVTWAPDVYDPVPTAASHVPNKGRHRSEKKKNGKSKHKSNGKSSRWSKGKDRKQQVHKHGGSSKRSSYPLEDNRITTSGFYPLVDDITDCSSGLQGSIVDFDYGNSSDPFCGSSFLKNSVTKLHFPVTEAT